MIIGETPCFHAGNRGSNPRGDANLQIVKSLQKILEGFFLILLIK